MSDPIWSHGLQLLGFPVHHQLQDLAQTHVHQISDAIQPSHPLSSPSPPPFNLFQHQVLFNEWVLHIRWPKYWSFSFSISPFNGYSGLISFRRDWLDLLAVQGTLKSLLQHHSSKASVLWCSAFFIVQISHSKMATGRNYSFDQMDLWWQSNVSAFSMLSRLVIAFLPRRKCLLISWLHSPSAVILEPKTIKFVTVSIVSPFLCHEVMGQDAMILVFWMLTLKPTFSLSSFTFIKRLFSSSLLSTIRVVSPAYLKLLMFLPAILMPACASPSPGFYIMYSAYKIIKQGDNIHPWATPCQFGASLLFHVYSNCCFLTYIQIFQDVYCHPA